MSSGPERDTEAEQYWLLAGIFTLVLGTLLFCVGLWLLMYVLFGVAGVGAGMFISSVLLLIISNSIGAKLVVLNQKEKE